MYDNELKTIVYGEIYQFVTRIYYQLLVFSMWETISFLVARWMQPLKVETSLTNIFLLFSSSPPQ